MGRILAISNKQTANGMSSISFAISGRHARSPDAACARADQPMTAIKLGNSAMPDATAVCVSPTRSNGMHADVAVSIAACHTAWHAPPLRPVSCPPFLRSTGLNNPPRYSQARCCISHAAKPMAGRIQNLLFPLGSTSTASAILPSQCFIR